MEYFPLNDHVTSDLNTRVVDHHDDGIAHLLGIRSDLACDPGAIPVSKVRSVE